MIKKINFIKYQIRTAQVCTLLPDLTYQLIKKNKTRNEKMENY